jgi:SAM-dependent methyltransferase
VKHETSVIQRGAPPATEAYFRLMADQGWSPENLRFFLRQLFAGIDLRGKKLLDVGAGTGVHSFYAASAGAMRVVSLEPEAAGSSAGVRAAFAGAAARLELDQVELVPQTIQEYDPAGEQFDVVLLHSSINHLDEDACVRLHHDPVARALYLGHFEKLAALAAPGATLIAVDCSRKNLFARVGKNPLAPTIEWEKHQAPELWADLLQQAGFEHPRIRWLSFNTLRSPGRLLLGNRFAAYFLVSAFSLTVTRAQTVD